MPDPKFSIETAMDVISALYENNDRAPSPFVQYNQLKSLFPESDWSLQVWEKMAEMVGEDRKWAVRKAVQHDKI